MKALPVLLTGLARQHCVVVGGDTAVESWVVRLLERDAILTLIAPQLSPTLQGWVDDGRATWFRRTFLPGDLATAFLVVVAHGGEADGRVVAEAETRGCLLAVVGDTAVSNVVLGGG